MAGFVRGGQQGRTVLPDSDRPVLTDPVREVVLIDGRDGAVLTEPQAHVVAAEQRNPLIVHVVEPVAIDAEGLDLRFADLRDVDLSDAAPGTPLALVLHTDGIYRTQAIDEQASGGVGYRHDQFFPSRRWQINHEMAFHPAGIIAVETDGTPIEYDQITYPLPGVVELEFGVPVAGTAWLS